MHILIAAPLYPPDIAPPAPYVKELATRLSAEHTVTVVAYGALPEEVPGVRVIGIPKDLSTPLRLWRFAQVLRQQAKQVDQVVIENGPATELPAALLTLTTSFSYILHCSDEKSLHNNQTHWGRRQIERLARLAAVRTIGTQSFAGCVEYCLEHPPERPEILPFTEYPKSAMAAYEAAWQKHISAFLGKLTVWVP